MLLLFYVNIFHYKLRIQYRKTREKREQYFTDLSEIKEVLEWNLGLFYLSSLAVFVHVHCFLIFTAHTIYITTDCLPGRYRDKLKCTWYIISRSKALNFLNKMKKVILFVIKYFINLFSPWSSISSYTMIMRICIQ